ncbi:Mitotic checkpoint protein PRCC [Handroanthus impetiginosus]|uniref:Mitotic checkpoint protein PRCC n=1 Tax=Handroanthus impetiginosus TaxID=429701 RepID=A0A2G9G307_9LAMI|nr:Mitotic checkpoint protein PRCC [Handroanthus impetiginosus]
MDSLLANYASSDEEEHEEQPSQIPPAKPVKSEANTAEQKDEVSLSKSSLKRGGIFDSLPPPKSSLFNSLPPPKSQSLPKPEAQAEFGHKKEVGERDEETVENPKPKSSSSFSSSLFSSLPPPKSSSSSSSAASKRVVQFRPPTVTNLYASGVDDKEDDDDDEDEKERQRKRSREAISTSSATSFSSRLPAPKHSATLGAMPSASGTGRRSMLETDNPASSASTGSAARSDAVNSSVGYLNGQSEEMNYDYSSWTSGSESHAYYSGYGAAPDGNVGFPGTDAGVNSDVGHLGDQSHDIYHHSSSLGGESYAYYGGYGVDPGAVSSVSTAGDDAGVNYSNAGSYEAVDYSSGNGHAEYQNYGGSYGDYGNNAQYENNWANATALPEVSSVLESAQQVPGKRGRKDAPAEIVEVKQDELMKNRPREDQVKLTGIAFGPAYQPASTKGKPSKLHKRKHQIGSLYFDLKQKEMELAERRSKGFLTKAQTQAKYGW